MRNEAASCTMYLVPCASIDRTIKAAGYTMYTVHNLGHLIELHKHMQLASFSGEIAMKLEEIQITDRLIRKIQLSRNNPLILSEESSSMRRMKN
jgi:hypothetical protein